jgi:hypothetical protein
MENSGADGGLAPSCAEGTAPVKAQGHAGA